MKTRLFILSSIVVSMVLFASPIFLYDKSKPPRVTLPLAYSQAVNALGQATNEFHCVSAAVTTDFGPDGEWQFTFYSTNSRPKWVTVEFNGKIHVEDVMNR
jgi:hypothetical protein